MLGPGEHAASPPTQKPAKPSATAPIHPWCFQPCVAPIVVAKPTANTIQIIQSAYLIALIIGSALLVAMIRHIPA